jgi:hypothetical protein
VLWPGCAKAEREAQADGGGMGPGDAGGRQMDAGG